MNQDKRQTVTLEDFPRHTVMVYITQHFLDWTKEQGYKMNTFSSDKKMQVWLKSHVKPYRMDPKLLVSAVKLTSFVFL